MYNNYQSYIGYPQMQNNPYLYGQQFNNQQQNIQPEYLSGTIVDSIDVVKAKNCNLDGSTTYYPKSDKSEIYCKQLNPQTGAGMILTYKLVNPMESNEISTEQQVATLLSNFKNEISNEISELKAVVLDNSSKPSFNKGGVKNV